jgi:hypothetical protein
MQSIGIKTQGIDAQATEKQQLFRKKNLAPALRRLTGQEKLFSTSDWN